MGKQNRYKSTIERAKLIRILTERYYEAGNYAKCYKSVWRRYINPVYPMCYRTYLNYLNIPAPAPAPVMDGQLEILWDAIS